MNIAFVTRGERNSLNTLYLQHVIKAGTELVAAGHQVMVVMDKGNLLEEISFPDEIELVEIEFQNSPWRTRYLSETQAVSDQFLLAVSAINQGTQLDVIEFPLWGGLGFSTIRCKRLLGYCKSTKIVTNAIFAHALSEEAEASFFPSIESEAIAEMEAYVLRYSDLVCSPFEIVGEKLQKKLGRSDIKYYGSLPLAAQLADTDTSDPVVEALKALIMSQGENRYAPLRAEEIFAQPGRKVFSKKNVIARIAVFVPFNAENPESYAENFTEMGDDTLEIVHYCDAKDEAVQKAYLDFEPSRGLKYEAEIGNITVFDAFKACKSSYLMILSSIVDAGEVYLKTAVSSLINNPELAYVGAYLGGTQYPLTYIPTLMPFINTCSLFGNVFRKRSLLSCLEDREITFSATVEWDILNAIHQRYLNGDILPHAFCRLTGDVDDPALAATERLRDAMQKQKSWAAKSARILKLLVTSPELLTAKGPKMVISDEAWEFALPVCQNLLEEAVVVVETSEETAIKDNREPEKESVIIVEPEIVVVEEVEAVEEPIDEASDVDTDDVADSEPVTASDMELSPLTFDEKAGKEDPEPDEVEADEETEMDKLVPDDVHAPESEEEVIDLVEDDEPIQLPTEEPETLSGIPAEEEVVEQEEVISEPEPIIERTADTEDDRLDWFQVFWARDGQFIEKDSITEPYQQGKHLYLEFAINAAREVNTIRLDPCNRAGVISIRKIEVRDNESGLIVFSASEDNAFDNIIPSGDFEVSGIEQDALILKSIGSDPQLIIQVKHTIIKHFTLTMKYDYRRLD